MIQNTIKRRETLRQARQWWATLSINEGKALCAQYKAVVINSWPLPSWLLEMYLDHQKPS